MFLQIMVIWETIRWNIIIFVEFCSTLYYGLIQKIESRKPKMTSKKWGSLFSCQAWIPGVLPEKRRGNVATPKIQQEYLLHSELRSCLTDCLSSNFRCLTMKIVSKILGFLLNSLVKIPKIFSTKFIVRQQKLLQTTNSVRLYLLTMQQMLIYNVIFIFFIFYNYIFCQVAVQKISVSCAQANFQMSSAEPVPKRTFSYYIMLYYWCQDIYNATSIFCFESYYFTVFNSIVSNKRTMIWRTKNQRREKERK